MVGTTVIVVVSGATKLGALATRQWVRGSGYEAVGTGLGLSIIEDADVGAIIEAFSTLSWLLSKGLATTMSGQLTSVAVA